MAEQAASKTSGRAVEGVLVTPNHAVDPAPDQFAQRIAQAMQAGTCERILLANPGAQSPLLPEPNLQRILARAVVLKGQTHLSLVYRYTTRDVTKNLLPDEAVAHLLSLCGVQGFRNAHLFLTDGQEIQLAFSKKGRATLRVGKSADPSMQNKSSDAKAAAMAAGSHNREKQRWLTQDRPFLRELGVTDASGQIVPAMSRKWKQINKFLEVFASALASSPLAPTDATEANHELHVVDFGSGKGYLTFAVHDWLRHAQGLNAKVTGVELRDDMVALCAGVIERLGLVGMQYEQGDVRNYHPAHLNVVIALHACDVATDHAIHLGVRAGADIIMCSPCCHKEIRPQLLSPHPMGPILQHGIHLGQQAEMLTDGLRALLLEACGYDTQVFEFISLEHTNKNKMILAVKRAQESDAGPVWQQIADIKHFYGIQAQCLETLLKQA